MTRFSLSALRKVANVSSFILFPFLNISADVLQHFGLLYDRRLHFSSRHELLEADRTRQGR